MADHPEWLGGLADGGEPAAAADAASRKAAAAGRSPGADGAAGEGEPGSGAADEGAGADGEAVPEPGPGDDGGGAGATAEADPAMGDGADAAAREEAGAEDRDARKSAEADRSGADDDVSAPPPGVPGRATRPAPSERASVGGDRGATSSPSPSRDRDPEPPPSSDLPPGSVTLAVEHRPVAAGDAGATDLVQVKIPGAPADTRVTLHSGPAGGPFQQRAMRSRGSGRWEAWLNFDVPGGTAMEYWIVASHPAADADSASGSRSAPHVVEVR